MGSKKDNEILTLDQLQTELADDTKIKVAGIDVDGTRPFNPVLLPLLIRSARYPPWESDVQEEVPVCSKGGLWLLQRRLWLGHARPDLLPRARDQQQREWIQGSDRKGRSLELSPHTVGGQHTILLGQLLRWR